MAVDRNAETAGRIRRNFQRLAESNNYVFNAQLTGTINGTNAVFTLPSAPRSGTLMLYVNGLLMREGGDYTRSGATVTFLAGAVPETGDWMSALYAREN